MMATLTKENWIELWVDCLFILNSLNFDGIGIARQPWAKNPMWIASNFISSPPPTANRVWLSNEIVRNGPQNVLYFVLGGVGGWPYLLPEPVQLLTAYVSSYKLQETESRAKKQRSCRREQGSRVQHDFPHMLQRNFRGEMVCNVSVASSGPWTNAGALPGRNINNTFLRAPRVALRMRLLHLKQLEELAPELWHNFAVSSGRTWL